MSRESSRRGSRTKGAIQQRPFKQPRLVFPPIRVISDDQVEAIHRAGLRLLRDIGFRVLAPEARALFAGAGATIDDLMVRFDPELIESLVAKAPSSFTLSARNPSHDLVVGDGLALFVGVGGPAYVQDLEGGRRPGSYAELEDYYRVMQSLNAIHQEGGGAFEPLDLDPETRHLDIHLATATLMDKNWQGVGLGRVRARDGMEMAALSLGLKSAADLQERPTLLTVINTNSPLVLDEPMAEGLIEFARFGQPVAVTPFTLAGAMSPITLAGALAQQHAEALATIALTQIVRPGCPVVYGAFTSNVDMKSGAPAFGTPEYVQAAQASGQLARRLKIPFRSSNVTSANEVDAQATYESMMALWGALLGGVNVLEHAAGWLGGGLTASFEKLVLDAELLQMMSAYFEPFAVDEAALAFDAVKDVGPGGHFFGTAHTLERYAGAFYQPLLSNYDNFDTWSDRGKISATQRAHTIWKKLLADYEKPPIDPSVEEALKDYVARRKRGWLPQA